MTEITLPHLIRHSKLDSLGGFWFEESAATNRREPFKMEKVETKIHASQKFFLTLVPATKYVGYTLFGSVFKRG
jgi:hypothetical protein